jgi:hypothetical protein
MTGRGHPGRTRSCTLSTAVVEGRTCRILAGTDSSRAIGRHCTQITDFLFRRYFSIRNTTRVRESASGELCDCQGGRYDTNSGSSNARGLRGSSRRVSCLLFRFRLMAANWNRRRTATPWPAAMTANRGFESAFGRSTPFAATGTTLFPSGYSRNFSSFDDASRECVEGRMLSGNHFRFSDEDALYLGQHISRYVLRTTLATR